MKQQTTQLNSHELIAHLISNNINMQVIQTLLRLDLDFNYVHENGYTVLSAFGALCFKLKTMLELRADVNHVIVSTGQTPMHKAIDIGNNEVIKLLAAYNPDMTIENFNFITAENLLLGLSPEFQDEINQALSGSTIIEEI